MADGPVPSQFRYLVSSCWPRALLSFLSAMFLLVRKWPGAKSNSSAWAIPGELVIGPAPTIAFRGNLLQI